MAWFKRTPVNVAIELPKLVDDQHPMPKMVLIHGAHQSNATFEYFRNALPGFHYINLDWNAEGGFHTNLSEMKAALADVGPVYLVGHSMGAIYAAHLPQIVECVGGSAIAAPWGGSRAADWVRYMVPNYLLYREVGTKSPIILDALAFKLPGHWCNYISTQGNVPGMGGPNDCVLTIDSMSARRDIKTKYIAATHYEIVMCKELIQSVAKNYLKSAQAYNNGLDNTV